MKLPRPSFRSLVQPSRKLLPLQRCGITQTAYQSPHHVFLRPQRSYSSVVSAANVQFGQPVHETHPHILKAGERKYILSLSLSFDVINSYSIDT